MSIFTSNLPNDRDLICALGSGAVPLPLFTDACFSSCDGRVIAAERKKVGDLAQCINDGRFLFQAQGCAEADCDIMLLILEGRYRRNPDDGLLEVPVWGVNPRTMRRAEVWQPVRPTMQFARFTSYLWELPFLAGIYVLHSDDVRGTADLILALYDWFQRPGHQSLKQMFKPPAPTVQLVRPSLVRRVASELPGIGYERSGTVAAHFPSVRAMCAAEWQEWAGLEGIGKKTAQKVVQALGREC